MKTAILCFSENGLKLAEGLAKNLDGETTVRFKEHDDLGTLFKESVGIVGVIGFIGIVGIVRFIGIVGVIGLIGIVRFIGIVRVVRFIGIIGIVGVVRLIRYIRLSGVLRRFGSGRGGSSQIRPHACRKNKQKADQRKIQEEPGGLSSVFPRFSVESLMMFSAFYRFIWPGIFRILIVDFPHKNFLSENGLAGGRMTDNLGGSGRK